jgi:hypothetical protein
MTNIEFVSPGLRTDLKTLKLLTIIDHRGQKMMYRIPTDREPTHPGEMLLEEFLMPMG